MITNCMILKYLSIILSLQYLILDTSFSFASFLYQDLLNELIDIEDMKLVGDGLLLNDQVGNSSLINSTMKAEKEGGQSLFKPNGNGGEIDLTLISESVTAGVEVGGEVSPTGVLTSELDTMICSGSITKKKKMMMMKKKVCM